MNDKFAERSGATEDRPLTPEQVNNLHFEWQRYWLPLDVEIQSGWGKPVFFPDPEDKYGKYYNPLAATLAQLAEHRLLVLCGEPASGKTTVITDYFERRDHDVLLIRFHDVLSAEDFQRRCFGHQKWQSLAQDQRPLCLVIESLDEGRVQFPNLFDRLLTEIQSLGDLAKTKLRLVLTCRSFDWESLRGREVELRRVMGLSVEGANEKQNPGQTRGTRADYCVWRLCPLRQTDVKMAAALALRESSESILEKIFDRGMEGFAAWPHTLKMILQECLSGTFETKTRRQLYEDYSLKLCRYQRISGNEDADWDATLEDRFLVTKQLAALLICSGKKYIRIDQGQMDESDIGIGQITMLARRAVGGSSLSRKDVLAALRTANFSEYGPLRLGFNQTAHQECLAAGYLDTLPRIQLRPIFFRTDFQGRHVIPSLTHTASWVAEHRGEFRADLMECNPAALLRSDVTDLPVDCKPVLVDKMIGLAEAGTFVGNGRFFFEGLRHPEIVAQFRSYLGKADLSDASRELLFDMIRQIAPAEMADDLLAICKSDGQKDRENLLASLALIAVATKAGTDALVALLNDKEFLAADKRLNARGKLLQRLVPSRIPAREAFKWMEPAGRLEDGPSYYMFLETHLPAALTQEDILAGLTFFSKSTPWPSRSSAKGALAEQVILMALASLDQPEIASLLSTEWLKKHSDDTYGEYHGSEKVRKLLVADEILRKRFSSLLIDAMEGTAIDDFRPFHMLWSTVLVANDLLWVLRQVKESTGSRQARWARTFASNFNWWQSSVDFFAEHHEEIHAAMGQSPDLEAALEPVFSVIDLESEAAKIQREHYQRKEKWAKKERRALKQQPWDSVVAKCLNGLQNEPSRWVSLTETLRYNRSWSLGRSDNDDDDRLIGWRLLDVRQQSVALEGARQFLLTKEDSEALSPASGTNYSEAAGAAVELILDELVERPDLADAVAKKWIPSVIWHGFMNRREEKQIVVDVLYKRWPEAVAGALLLDVASAAERDEGLVLSVFHGFERCFDARIYAIVVKFLRGAVRDRSVADIGEWLAEHHKQYFNRLLAEVIGEVEAFPEAVRLYLLAVGIRQLPEETWPYFERYVFADTGTDVVRAAADVALVRHARGFQGISDVDLGRLFDRVEELFPHSEDPPFKRGVQERQPGQRVADFRNSILQELTDRATPESVAELLRLRQAVPKTSDRFLWNVHQATENLRMRFWNPPAVESLAAVILSPETSRLAETSEALLDVVIESLERLQGRLTNSNNPRVLDFWRVGVGGPKPNRENRGPYYEEDISWRLAAWLQDDLTTWFPALVGREVQPRWNQRTDITIDALQHGTSWATKGHPKVVLEVKGAWHAKVANAATSQLVDAYLAHEEGAVGLFVVCWFGADFEDEGNRTNKLKARSFAEAQAEVEGFVARVAQLRPGFLVKGLVLDFSLTAEICTALSSDYGETSSSAQKLK